MKYWLTILICFTCSLRTFSHELWKMHAQDMYDVFQFAEDQRLTDWMRYISSELIDQPNSEKVYVVNGQHLGFYDYLKVKYPDFKCKHRLLLHWGYNSRPWTPYLQEKVNSLGWSEEQVKELQQDLIAEQKRRNSKTNAMTEDLFCFEHGGKEARIARVMVSIAYDTHILGDYEPDNSDLDGLQDINSVIGDIINNIRALDKQAGNELIKRIQNQSKDSSLDVQYRAQAVLNILKESFSPLLQSIDNGNLKSHIEKQGFRFEKRVSVDCSKKKSENRITFPTQSIKKNDNSHELSPFVYMVLATLILLTAIGTLVALKRRKNERKIARRVRKRYSCSGRTS